MPPPHPPHSWPPPRRSAVGTPAGSPQPPRPRPPDGRPGGWYVPAPGRGAVRAARRLPRSSRPSPGDTVRGTPPPSSERRGQRPVRGPERRRPRLAASCPTTRAAAARGNWQRIQWNFLASAGHQRARRLGEPDRRAPSRRARGQIAVLDTGVAYRRTKRFRRSPDFVGHALRPRLRLRRSRPLPRRRERPRHVRRAASIGERVNNGRALTGIAYGATIMPVRVLDARGDGRRRRHRRGHPLRRAPQRAGHQPQPRVRLLGARSRDPRGPERAPLRQPQGRPRRRAPRATRPSAPSPTPPAPTASSSVGATTEHGCQAEYSNDGAGPRPRGAGRRRRRRRIEEDPTLPPQRPAGARHLPAHLRAARSGASGCRAATRARRWRRPTCPRPPRSSSPAA